jgi:hypothetical protein
MTNAQRAPPSTTPAEVKSSSDRGPAPHWPCRRSRHAGLHQVEHCR